jgi:hypothetical protein
MMAKSRVRRDDTRRGRDGTHAPVMTAMMVMAMMVMMRIEMMSIIMMR